MYAMVIYGTAHLRVCVAAARSVWNLGSDFVEGFESVKRVSLDYFVGDAT